MAQLSLITIALTGLTPSFDAVSASDKVKQPTDQRLFVHVKNGGGSSINVTIPAAVTSVDTPAAGRVTIGNIVVAVPNGAERMIGPFPPAYVDAAGDVTFQYSATASVTAKAFKLPRVG